MCSVNKDAPLRQGITALYKACRR